MRMLERYYETGEGNYDIQTHNIKKRMDRRKKMMLPIQEESTERMEITVDYPDMANPPQIVYVERGGVESGSEDEDVRKGERSHQRMRMQREEAGWGRERREGGFKNEKAADVSGDILNQVERYVARLDEKTGTYHLGLQCFFFDSGQPCISNRIPYQTGSMNDQRLAQLLKDNYKQMGRAYRSWPRRLFAPSKLTFVKFVKFEWGKIDAEVGKEWTATSKKNIIPSRNKKSMAWFEWKLKNSERTDDRWTKKLDRMVTQNAIVKIQLLETLDKTFIYLWLSLMIAVSLIFTIVYGVIRNDFSTAFSGASWLVTSSALLAAVLAAGQWFGGLEQELEDSELKDENDNDGLTEDLLQQLTQQMQKVVENTRPERGGKGERTSVA